MRLVGRSRRKWVRSVVAGASLAAILVSRGAPAQDLDPADIPDWQLRRGVGEEAAATPVDCAERAALYAGGGFRLWVTRTGTLSWENPLRPLSPERLVVLQVSVNGRIASAYGPDHDNLRQGASPRRIEEETGASIRWEAGTATLPAAIRVVAEDGRVILGPLDWQSCGNPPRASRAGPAAEPAPPAARLAPRSDAPRPRLPLPQGAIPE